MKGVSHPRTRSTKPRPASGSSRTLDDAAAEATMKLGDPQGRDTETLEEVISVEALGAPEAIVEKIGGYRVHPAARLLPEPSAEDFARLKADIEQHGLIVPIRLTPAGEILDGRTRARICEDLGIKWGPNDLNEFYNKMTVTLDAEEARDPVAYVLSANTARRHLTGDQVIAIYLEANKAKIEAEQQAARATRQANLKKGAVRPEGSTVSPSGKTAAKIAKALGKSESAVKRVRRVKQVAPERFAEMVDGKASADEILKQNVPETKQNKVKTPANEQPVCKRYKPGSPKWVEEQVQAICEASSNLQSVYPKLTGGQYGQQVRISGAQKALGHVARIGANFAQVNQVSRELVQLWNQQGGEQVEVGEYLLRRVKEVVANVPYIRPWKLTMENINAAQGSSWFTSEHFEWLIDISDVSELEFLEKEWAPAASESAEGAGR